MSINTCTISGNLTRDAEERTAPSGMAVVTFTVAVNEPKKAQDGWEEYTNYIPCTCFGKFAESVAPKLTKGSKVCVAGSLRYSAWEKDGAKRSKVEVIASKIEVMGAPKQEQPQLYDDDLPW